MIHRALSSLAGAFIESILWKAEIDGLIGQEGWLTAAETKDAWRKLLTEMFERHGEDLS